ncbi:MAG TPA: TonB-dependent receptor [Porphyromonadaceae bacterium]|nr:TonB-dependent receptor [Porphyromonadaceae bacterium]
MKQKLWLWLFCLCALPAFAQTPAGVSGKVIDELTGDPIAGVMVVLRENNQTAYTGEDGAFVFHPVTHGKDILSLNAADIQSKEIPVDIPHESSLDLGIIQVTRRPMPVQQLAGVIDEAQRATEDDDTGLSQDVSAMVIFSNDVFLQNAGYQFSQFRFRSRGYENRFEDRYINGVNFNDQIRGVFNYSSIGALNDMTRNGDAVNYFAPSSFTFGSIGGSENINMRAGNYTRGGKVTLSLTNRNYYARAMGSYSTGMQDNGWAFTASVGGRYSHEGHIEGVFYRNISYFVGLEKEIAGGKHRISFVTFGSPVERGQQGSSYQEVYDLVDNNLYNPNWGYQNGKKRNARVVKSFDPTAILSHVWELGENTTLTSGVAAHYSRYGGSALNWYNGPDPRPDYYRYLPSYNRDNQKAFDYYTYLWKTSSDESIAQLDWDKMWEANHLNNLQGDGSAIYMMEERRKDLFETALNSTLNTQLSPEVKLTAGIGLKHSLSKQFKTVDDLLGAQYVLDIDKFAERDFAGDRELIQNDLERPDRKVYTDDVFGYDFRFRVNSADIWWQQEHTYRNIDLYYGAKLKYTQFQREGKMRNGRYPANSLGKGKMHRFTDYATKAGITYKLNGRHFFTGNISYQTMAPLVDNVYISPRITDLTVNNMKSVRVFSADLNYIFSLPSLMGRVSVFNTHFYDDVDHMSYYHDSERTFVNHVLSGIEKVHQGIEVGLNYKLNENWNFDVIGTTGEYYYANNPEGVISYENGKGDIMAETAYMKDYYVGGTPQTMGTFGINFFYDYWFLNLNINGFAGNYIEIAPFRRLASNYAGIQPPGTGGFDENLYDAYRFFTHQEKFKGGYTLDLGIGKIWYLANRNSINFNLSVNNLLNRTDIRTGGYEQARINLDYPNRFASKYYYMQGINCFLNMSYRF